MKREDAAISKTRTVRFQSIVEACGKPEMVVLWTAPEKDSHFHSAVKQQRIMTVLQPAVGTQKDFGVIGFQPQKNASYLKFPKSLERFANARIVGINYDLIQTPKAVSRVLPEVKPSGRLSPANSAFPTGGRLAHEFPAEPPHPVPRSHRAGREPRPAAPPRPKLKEFRVTVRFEAVAEVSQVVTAKSRKDATNQALQAVRQPDLNRGTITKRIIHISD